MTPELKRERSLRAAILRMVKSPYDVGVDVGVRLLDIYKSMATCERPVRREEVDAVVADLRDRGLIAMETDETDMSPLPGRILKITARGRDFVNAGFPWDKLESF